MEDSSEDSWERTVCERLRDGGARDPSSVLCPLDIVGDEGGVTKLRKVGEGGQSCFWDSTLSAAIELEVAESATCPAGNTKSFEMGEGGIGIRAGSTSAASGTDVKRGDGGNGTKTGSGSGPEGASCEGTQEVEG